MKKYFIVIPAALIILGLALFFILKPGSKKFQVNFETDGGTKVTAIELKKGEKLKKPTDPTKEGYTFVNWLLDEEEYDFSKPVEKAITLKANWKEKEPTPDLDPASPTIEKFKVTFKPNNGKNNTVVEVEKDKTVSKIKDPTRTNYKFLGWYLNNKEYNFKTQVTDNITLEAKWESIKSTLEKFKVTFKPNNGKANTVVEVEKTKQLLKLLIRSMLVIHLQAGS
jgi:uncharacterized repeat protein (TIGR02543 family)